MPCDIISRNTPPSLNPLPPVSVPQTGLTSEDMEPLPNSLQTSATVSTPSAPITTPPEPRR